MFVDVWFRLNYNSIGSGQLWLSITNSKVHTTFAVATTRSRNHGSAGLLLSSSNLIAGGQENAQFIGPTVVSAACWQRLRNRLEHRLLYNERVVQIRASELCGIELDRMKGLT